MKHDHKCRCGAPIDCDFVCCENCDPRTVSDAVPSGDAARAASEPSHWEVTQALRDAECPRCADSFATFSTVAFNAIAAAFAVRRAAPAAEPGAAAPASAAQNLLAHLGQAVANMEPVGRLRVQAAIGEAARLLANGHFASGAPGRAAPKRQQDEEEARDRIMLHYRHTSGCGWELAALLDAYARAVRAGSAPPDGGQP